MKPVLLLTDYSKNAAHAAEYALNLARQTKSELILFHALLLPQVYMPNDIMPYYGDFSEIEKEQIEKLKELKKKLEAKAVQQGVQEAVPTISYISQPGELKEVSEPFIEDKGIGLVVMGEKEKESFFDRILLGSDAKEIIDSVSCPVLLVPPHAKVSAIKKIMLAIDINDVDESALKSLGEFCRQLDADLILRYISEDLEDFFVDQKKRDNATKILNMVNYSKASFDEAWRKDIVKGLDAIAQGNEADVLAMIHKQRPFLSSLFHSSTTKKMIYNNHTPLLVIPSK